MGSVSVSAKATTAATAAFMVATTVDSVDIMVVIITIIITSRLADFGAKPCRSGRAIFAD
jgi:hypothetical protein